MKKKAGAGGGGASSTAVPDAVHGFHRFCVVIMRKFRIRYSSRIMATRHQHSSSSTAAVLLYIWCLGSRLALRQQVDILCDTMRCEMLS